jgi:tetratricopeptide (TPR) repeat protein
VLVLALCVGQLVATTTRVEAAPGGAEENARAAFEHGRTLYRLTRFAEALEAFSRAYEALPEPAFLYNIAQCQRELGRDDDAVKAYHQYLAAIPSADPSRTDVEREVATLEARIDARAREAERLRLLASERDLELARTARLSAEQAASRPETTGRLRRARALIATGGVVGFVGLCGLSAGIATAVQMSGARSDLLADAHAGRAYDPSLEQRYDRGRTLSIAFFVTGGALTVAAAALLGRGLWERHRRETSR